MPTTKKVSKLVMPPKQPFWTSKTFWVLAVAFLINLSKQLFPSGISDQVAQYANEALVLLGIFFRWVADQPLTMEAENGSDVRKL